MVRRTYPGASGVPNSHNCKPNILLLVSIFLNQNDILANPSTSSFKSSIPYDNPASLANLQCFQGELINLATSNRYSNSS